MAQLIINEELEIEILAFERSLRKLENDIITDLLSVQVTSNNFNDELVDLLKNYLYKGSINKIEIKHNDEILHSSTTYDYISSITIEANFSENEANIIGRISFAIKEGE